MKDIEKKALRAGLDQLPSEGLSRLQTFITEKHDNLLLDGAIVETNTLGVFENI